jgi:hypothetical protein
MTMTLTLKTSMLALSLVSLWPTIGFTQGCHGVEGSPVGVETLGDLLPQRCDEPGKCRMFDLNGKPIGVVGDFVVPGASSEGLAAVSLHDTDLQGYMDASANWVIKAQFKRAGPFCEGRAAVERVDGRHVYIDRQGEEVGPSWDDAEAFTEGRGLVSVHKGGDKWLHGYVDPTGRLVIPATLAGARLFSEGRAAVRVDSDKWGYIDRDGKMVIEPRFGEAELFRSGRAMVRSEPDWGPNSGLIDESGKIVIEPRYLLVRKVADADLWTANIDPNFRGRREGALLAKLFDRNGHAVAAGIFDQVGGASEGLIDVCHAGKCGFIDAQGRTIVPLTFKYVGSFADGLAAATRDDNKYGFIDRSGKFVIEPRYDSLGPHRDRFPAGPFADGIAPAGCDGHWGFIDRQGAWVIPPVYLFAQSFGGGRADVDVRTGTGHIRRDGTPIDFAADEVDPVRLPARPCGAEVKAAH